MPNWWLVVGTPKNWEIAFQHNGIWGLKDSPRHKNLWDRISSDDKILFYVTSPASGIIGFGTVKTKFKQDRPLWPEEIHENKIIWPHRFEFDIGYLMPQEKWERERVVSDKVRALVQGGFQMIEEAIANEITIKLVPSAPVLPPQQEGHSIHDEIKNKLVEIGRIQKLVAESEYAMDGTRLDVVWRRIERGVPTYVFEVQVGGDLYHALGKLKHAHDLWNSNTFLILSKEDVDKATQLLSGTFHEISESVKLIESEKIERLFKLKKEYRDYEAELGIL